MNKKGFTLIELLAVIVILAIIALIATPIILNVISRARKGAAVDSAYGYIEAIEYQNQMNILNPEKYPKIESGDVTNLNSKVSVRGTKPDSGNVVVDNNKVVSATLCINGYKTVYQNNKVEVASDSSECSGGSSSSSGNSGSSSASNNAAPTVTGKSCNTINLSSNQTGDSIEYGYSTSENGTYTWQSESYFYGLTPGETYYFKTRVGSDDNYVESNSVSDSIPTSTVAVRIPSSGAPVHYDNNLQSAINDAAANETIYLCKNVSENITVASDKNIAISKGSNVKLTGNLTNSGTLTLGGFDLNGKLVNSGSITLSGGNYTNSTSDPTIYSTGQISLSGAQVKSTGCSHVLHISGSATLTGAGATIQLDSNNDSCEKAALYADGSSKINGFGYSRLHVLSGSGYALLVRNANENVTNTLDYASRNHPLVTVDYPNTVVTMNGGTYNQELSYAPGNTLYVDNGGTLKADSGWQTTNTHCGNGHLYWMSNGQQVGESRWCSATD